MIALPRTAPPRWRSNVPLFVAGAVAIVAGGFAAAVTGPTGWKHGSWVAAFLVLVVGVAQIGIGAAQAQLAPVSPNMQFVTRECAAWNAACLIVVAGTLLAAPIVVTLGSALLAVTVALSTFAVRGTGGQPMWLALYRGLLVVLLVSIPVGIALSWARH